MKILLVGQYSTGGGVSNYLENISKILSKRHDVHVLTYGTGSFRKNNVHEVRVPRLPGLRGLFFILKGTAEIIRLVEELQIDVVNAHYLGPPAISAVLARSIRPFPLVLTAHGSDVLGSRGRKFLSRLSLLEKSVVTAVSHALCRKLRVDCLVAPGASKTGGKRKNADLVLFVGSLVSYKEPQTVVELARKHGELRFVILGEGPLRKKLEKSAPPNVSFLGYREDVEKFLSRGLVLVVPSRWEGLGLVVLEANSWGVPVIARRTGGLVEVIRDGKNGLLFDDDLEDIFSALLDRKLNEKLGAVGRRVASLYSWNITVKTLERAYELALELFKQHSP